MSRILLVLMVLLGTAGAVVAYGDPKRISAAGDAMSTMLKKRVDDEVEAQLPGGPARFAIVAVEYAP